MRRSCLTFAAAGLLTGIFALSPLSLCISRSSLLPQLTTTKAEAFVTYRRARVATRRAYRRSWRWHGWHRPAYYAHPDGVGGYPYSAPYYAYRHVYAPPVAVVGHGWGWGGGGWHRPHWGPVRGWHWWR